MIFVGSLSLIISNEMNVKLILLFLFITNLTFAQDLASVRKRLTELGSYQAVLRYENKDWVYSDFSKKIKTSNGAFLRQNPRPVSEDIKKDLLQEVFFYLRMEPETNNKEKDEIKDRLYKTLSWWLIDKPQFRWTDSALDQPRYVGTILLLLYDTLKKDQNDPKYASIVKRIKDEAANYLRYSWNFGKADDRFLNLGDDLNEDVQRMGNVGYRLYAMTAIAASLDIDDLMNSVSQIAKNQLEFQINSGKSHPIALMPDFSFHQHNYGGGQLYNLGYGLDWFNDFVGYSYYVKDSKWALNEKELDLLVGFLQEGIYPFFMENGQFVDQALGRHNQVKSTWIKFPESRARLLRNFYSNQSKERIAIDNILSDLDFKKKLGFHSYYSSDFLIADIPKYSASVRLVSDRTSGQESGDNGQKNGMQNFFSSDGSFIQYFEDLNKVKGYWDWRKVPGTTTALIDFPLPYVPYGKNYSGFSSFAGVLNTDDGALIAGNLRRKSGSYQLEMVKSYILLEDLVLFWGFGLKYQGKEEVQTTVTQESWNESAFLVDQVEKTSIDLGFENLKQIKNPIGIWNNGTGYLVFPIEDNQIAVQVTAQSKKAIWEELDQRNKAENEEYPILTISIQHSDGKELLSDSYFYWMIPEIDSNDFLKMYNQGNIDLNYLDINQLEFSESNFSLTHNKTSWFVNFKKVGESKFSLAGHNFIVSGLIGGALQAEENQFKFYLTQMEKRESLGQDFSITIDNFDDIKLPAINAWSQPLKLKPTHSGIQIYGNTMTKNPLDFGSTFHFNIPMNSAN